ncbi:MAG: NUDIX domain-containing protein [Actinomycetaceae bacterium]|nr:NUDIX domain-containing protein [Actinomycetaceae bacterium]MDU0970917.1 NUDIX domain-containing protein [Actinomycetaceae bacterium]
MSRLIVAAIVVGADDTILASQRAYPESLRGLFEFPGGKLEDGETPRAALVRELREELSVEVDLGPTLPNPDREDGLWPILAGRDMWTAWARLAPRHTPRLTDSHLAHVWQPRAALADLPWLPPDLPIARHIAATPPPTWTPRHYADN